MDPKLTDAHGKKLEYFGDYDYDDAPDNDNCDWSNPWQVVVLPPATRTPPTKVRVRYVASGTDNEVGVVDPDRLVRRFVIHPVGTAVDVRADKVLNNGDKKKSEQMVIVGWDEDAKTYLVEWEGSVSEAKKGDSVWVTLDEIEGKVVKTFSDGFVEVKLADDWVVKFRNSEVLVLWPDKAHIVDQSFVRRRVSRACSRAVAGQTNPHVVVKGGGFSPANPDWFYSRTYRKQSYQKDIFARGKASGAEPSLEFMDEEDYYAHPRTKAKKAWRDAHPDYGKTYEPPVCPYCDSGLLKRNCFCGGPDTGTTRAFNLARRALRLALDAEVGGDVSEVTGFTPAQASQIMAAAVPKDVPLADLLQKKLVRRWTKGMKVTVLDTEHIKPIALMKRQDVKDLDDPVPAVVDGEPNDALRLISRIEGLQFMIFRECSLEVHEIFAVGEAGSRDVHPLLLPQARAVEASPGAQALRLQDGAPERRGVGHGPRRVAPHRAPAAAPTARGCLVAPGGAGGRRRLPVDFWPPGPGPVPLGRHIATITRRTTTKAEGAMLRQGGRRGSRDSGRRPRAPPARRPATRPSARAPGARGPARARRGRSRPAWTWTMRSRAAAAASRIFCSSAVGCLRARLHARSIASASRQSDSAPSTSFW